MTRLTHNRLKQYPNLRRRDNNEGAAVVEFLPSNSGLTTYRVHSDNEYLLGRGNGQWLTFAQIQETYTLD